MEPRQVARACKIARARSVPGGGESCNRSQSRSEVGVCGQDLGFPPENWKPNGFFEEFEDQGATRSAES
eukprot:11164167-Lingulodinium_polyedra.AAC.1